MGKWRLVNNMIVCLYYTECTLSFILHWSFWFLLFASYSTTQFKDCCVYVTYCTVQSFSPFPLNCLSCNGSWRFITTDIKAWCWHSVIVLCAGWCGVWFLAGTRICHPKMPIQALGPTKSPIHLVLDLFIVGGGEMVRWLEHKAGDLPSCSSEVKNQWRCASTLTICQPGTDRNNFTFLDCLTLEDGADRLPQNVSNWLPIDAA
jgi:hypothetical protein